MSSRRTHAAIALLALLLLAAAGCQKESQTQTTVPAAWRNPDLPRVPFTKLFVIGVGRNDEYRRLYEDSMVRALREQGAGAQASWALFPQAEKLDAARVLVDVEQQGFDAVVIARLRSVHEKEEYVPASPLTSSDAFMSGYEEAHAVKSSPAHFKTNTTYRVETSVYSVRDQMAAWLVLSDTVNPESVQDVIHSVSARIAAQMKAEGLVAQPSAAP